MTIDANTPAFKAFVAGCEAIIASHRARFGGLLQPDRLEIEEGRTFLKLVVWSDGVSRRVQAFVARKDGQTKALGAYRAGDVLKAATWAAPAKHARGNIFDASNGLASMGPHGPAYLK